MRRTSFARWPCSIARTMDLLGDQWTLLVLRESYLGTCRFDGYRRTLGIARNTLTERLDRLTGAGLLDRVRYQDKPARFEYRLTSMGADFYPAFTALLGWGDRWLADGDPPMVLRHDGHPTSADVRCAECGDPLDLETAKLEARP